MKTLLAVISILFVGSCGTYSVIKTSNEKAELRIDCVQSFLKTGITVQEAIEICKYIEKR
jgi:hypothetical protein